MSNVCSQLADGRSKAIPGKRLPWVFLFLFLLPFMPLHARTAATGAAMYFSRLYYVKQSPLLSGNAANTLSARALLRRWQEMRAAAPATATAPVTTLLKETLDHLQATAPVTTTELAASSLSTLRTPAAPTLLRSPRNSQLIWSVLQRQHVSWSEALLLLPWQLQTMPAAQRNFVHQRISTAPWDVAHAVLAARDVVDDAGLTDRFRALKRATYMVDFARLISATLRERPSLPDDLLPVPYGVMLHAYELGHRSSQDAAIALELSKHLTLLGEPVLSHAAEERLVLGHARLEGQVGNWAAALEVVAQSRAVRLSIRKGFVRFVGAMQREAVQSSASVSTQRMETGQSSGGHPAVSSRTAAAALVPSSGESSSAHNSTWLSALRSFRAQPPNRQTYVEARTVLATLPNDHTQRPDFVLVAVEVLRHSARRMYAGSLTRRLVSSTKKSDWSYALSLAAAARCYDMAVPLIPFLPPNTKLPPDLTDFCAKRQHIEKRLADSAAAAGLSSLPLTRAAAQELSYPEALAYALEGDAAVRQTLLSFCPHSQPLSRLRSLLLASLRLATAEEEADVEGSMSDVDCCTFQSSSLSQLVCAAASEKRQRYFYKVIPASMRAHHFRQSPLTHAPVDNCSAGTYGSAVEASPSVTHPYTQTTGAASASYWRLQRWRARTVTTPADCAALLADLSTFLRATHTVEGAPILGGKGAKPRLTEDVFLHCLAAFSAWGSVQLPATERFHWPLAVLKAAWLLRITLDASLVSSAVRSIPSMFVDGTELALPSILTAHTLLGDWQVGLQLCARLERKGKQSLVQLEAPTDGKKPHTVKYRAPSPTLREAMAQVGYAAPTQVALRHWTTLEALSTADASAFPVLLMELKQFKDIRQLCDTLRNSETVSSSHGRLNAKLGHLSRRRMLLGAAFSLLDNEAALRRVVRASGQRRVRAKDLDCHGLQRLLAVLPPATVSRVLKAEAAEGRCSQEHWLLSCMSHSSVPVADVRHLAQLRPTSGVLSAVCCFRSAVEDRKPVLCIKALKHMAEKAVESPARRALLMCIAQLLRIFLSNDELLEACVQRRTQYKQPEGMDPGYVDNVARDAQREAQMLFNRLQEVEPLSGNLKQTRRVVRHTIDARGAEAPSAATSSLPAFTTSACATWVLLSSLQQTTAHVLRLPVPAAFTSYLLMRAVATGTDDWRAALFFFNELRHPTDAERAALVLALRPCGANATSLLLPHRRFMRHLPEQLILWADEAGGSSKWERSIALLARAQRSKTETDMDNDASKPAATPREGEPTTSVLSLDVQATVKKWNADECFRAVQLLRRQGFVKLPAKRERSLKDVEMMETDPHARRQIEAILELLSNGTAEAGIMPAPFPSKKPSTKPDLVPVN